jgi:uncharacterized sodium:solute symporter family permease YidK
MVQGNQKLSDYPHRISIFNRNFLLRRHPVLTPVLLLSGALVSCIASLFPDALFPILAFLGIPPAGFCLSLAFILGVVGALISIIGILEHIDRYSLRTAVFAELKEHCYANRN